MCRVRGLCGFSLENPVQIHCDSLKILAGKAKWIMGNVVENRIENTLSGKAEIRINKTFTL